MSDKDKFDDDDYVAKLLAEDAKKSSHRYAAAGLSALLPKRPTKSAVKPNTRFLNHIIREADSHNAALKKKEELEARIRLREMKDKDRHQRERDRDRRGDPDRPSKRRRLNSEDDKTRSRHRHSRDSRRSPSPRSEGRSHRHYRRETERKRDAISQPSKGSHHPNGRSRDKHRSRSRSPQSDPDRRRSRPRRTSPPASHKQHSEREDSESDPLEELVGPLPQASHLSKNREQVRIRGRGAYSSTASNIDTHFSATYDPASDVHPDELTDEREDWDMALEALRDRAAWKRKQTERMREAGFEDEDIQKWERSAVHTGLGGRSTTNEGKTNMKWIKKGETRSWDMGKKEFIE